MFIKVAVEGLSPILVVVARMLLGAAVLLSFVAIRRDRLPGARGFWVHLAVAALVANVIPYFLFGWGEQHVSSATAGVLNATTPLFTVLLVLITKVERVTLYRTAGLGVGFLGTLLIFAPWQAAGFAGSTAGRVACLSASASYGVSYVYMRRFLTGRGFSPLGLSASQLAAGTVLAGLATPVMNRGSVSLTLPVLASVLALGVFGTGIAYVLNYRLIQDEGATAASTVTYLLPVVAVLLGAIVLHESIGWHTATGTAVILLGVAIAEGRVEVAAPSR
jgi:drug/metabolite transporter (DMT)-like permease